MTLNEKTAAPGGRARPQGETADKPQAVENKPPEVIAPPPPRRPPGHRSTDVRDTVAEMAARAQEISQEAGSKVAAAMKDVIGAAAGIAGFAIESARDLVQYMVRRGQMTQEEADKLMREAEEANSKRKPFVPTRSTATPSAPVATISPIRSGTVATSVAAPAPSYAKPGRAKTAQARAKPAARVKAKPAARAKAKPARAKPKARPKATRPARAKARPKGTKKKR